MINLKNSEKMTRFNYLPKAIYAVLIAGIGSVMTGCGSKDKAVTAGPVRVDVDVVGDAGQTASGQTYSGTVESADASTLSFSVPGTITKIYVKEGQKVSKGQLLAQVKSENLINSRNIAQAELEEARDAYARLKKLHDANALPDIKWVEIQSKLKEAENAAALANRAVGDASLYSPINGYVAERMADDGQTVVPAEPIFKVMSLNNLQVSIPVPENEISAFGPNVTAIVDFDVADGVKSEGKLVRKDIVADPLTRTYSVIFDIENPDGRILPGMVGSVTVKGLNEEEGDSTSKVVTLPSQALLLSSDNRQFVWTVKDGKAERKYVIADELSGRGVTVKKGLSAGDSVIVAGMQKVSTGTEVVAVNK